MGIGQQGTPQTERILYTDHRIQFRARGVVWIILLAFGADDPGSNPGGPVLSIVYFQTDLPSFTTLSSTKFVHASSRICCFVISVGEKSCLNIETKMVEMFINRYELITQNMEHTFFESFSLYPKVQEKLQRV